jgi:hypothetical protein
MRHELNARIAPIPIPLRMRSPKISDEGFPVPYFVAWVDGKPDFRTYDGERFGVCLRHKRCWLCGEPLGKFMTFVLGPMCSVNRTTAEPPCHRDCARYAVEACPFLTQPRMRRNEKDMPAHAGAAGFMIRRNPGCSLLWVTESYKVFRAVGGSGVLFRVGDPLEIEYWTEGRKACRDEVLASIESGLPELKSRAVLDGPEAVAELDQMYQKALTLLPAA